MILNCKSPILHGAFFFLFLLSFNLNAQYHEIGVSAGALNYKGELSPEFTPLNYRPAVNAFYRYNFNPDVALRAGLLFGQISGNDKYWNLPLNKWRGAQFSSILAEIEGMFEFNFFSYRKLKGGMKYTLYLTGGVAAYYYQAKTGSPVMPALPVGLGFKYAFLKQFNIGFEFGSRFLFSNFLDNTYDPNNLNRPGDSHNIDMYLYNGFWISYTFYEVNCPGHYVW